MPAPINPGFYVAPGGTAHYFRDSATSLCGRAKYDPEMPKYACNYSGRGVHVPHNGTACTTCQDANEEYWLSVYPRVDTPQCAGPARN